MIVVAKFGGSTLKDAADYRRAADVIAGKRAKGDEVVAVVSATYKTTDELIAAAKASEGGDSSAFEKIFEKHAAIAGKLNDKAAPGAKNGLEGAKALLSKFLAIDEMEVRSAAMQSLGERMSAVLLAAFLEEKGVAATAVSAEDAGILAMGGVLNGTVVMEETKRNVAARVKPMLKKTVPVVTGYFGVRENGEILLFGRGGSDYSAGIMAACLGAGALEFWKDVPGFMSADPKTVPGARLLEKISYREVEELGYMGAKVMHPRAVVPLKGTGTPVYIRNILKPGQKGTVVSEGRSKPGAKAVAGKEAAVVTVKGVAYATAPGMAASVFAALERVGVSVDLISTSEVDISFTTGPGDADKAAGALKELREAEEVTVEKGLATVGVVGEGLRESGDAAKLFSFLAEESGDVTLVSQDAREIAISFAVPAAKMKECIRRVHEKVIGR